MTVWRVNLPVTGYSSRKLWADLFWTSAGRREDISIEKETGKGNWTGK